MNGAGSDAAKRRDAAEEPARGGVHAPMPRWIRAALTTAALLACVLLFAETKELAEIAGSAEHELRAVRLAAQDAAAAAAGELAAAREREAATAAHAARLERELATAQAQIVAMAGTVAARVEAETRAAEQGRLASLQSVRAMPEGVRLCLRQLHDCLRAEGYGGQRFLRARRLDAEGLHDVELLDAHADGLGAAVVTAALMTATLDRTRGRLELRFFDGARFDGGERTELPEEGLPLVFEPITGRMFEERLPYLVRVEGVYPEAERSRRPATDVDPATRLLWLERFDTLLAAARTQHTLRVQRFRGMDDGRFLAAQVLGTDEKHRLVVSAECARLAVEIDEAAGVVSLLLQDGALRQGGVESSISAEGYRMLLPDVTPQQASDTMLGMVVRR